MLAHNVYFALHDNSEAAKRQMIAACKKYLTGHPGTMLFGCGILQDELNRPVNVRDFDVALHVVFESLAAHDAYQDAESHHQFIAENKENWKHVRVFDSQVEPG